MLKKRSGKNLIHFFYHLLVVLFMALPMISGLVRVIYVQANQNAFESYYGDTINEIQYTNSNLIINREYIFSTNRYDNISGIDFGTGVENTLTFNVLEVLNNSTSYDLTIINRMTISKTYGNVGMNYYYCAFWQDTTLIFEGNTTQFTIEFKLQVINGTLTQNTVEYGKPFYLITYNNYSYLDNAFDYSIWKTMQDFTFHSDFRFTDLANGLLMTFDNNNLYIQYTNFYINWLLTCAVISFAPYVLLSFYHLAIHLLDKFMRKGEDL